MPAIDTKTSAPQRQLTVRISRGTGDGSLFTVTLDGISLEADADGTTLAIDTGNLVAYALSSKTTTDTWSRPSPPRRRA